jgi:hypothetical protein
MTDIIKRNTETEVGLEVKVDKTKYTCMLLSSHQNAGQNHNTKRVNTSSGNVTWFNNLGTIVTNQNLIQKEIKG